jgi:hypothetical protein
MKVACAIAAGVAAAAAAGTLAAHAEMGTAAAVASAHSMRTYAAAVQTGGVNAPAAPARVSDGLAFTASGQVQEPTSYRDWVFLSSGLGMTYGPAAPAAGRPPLVDNVFVNPQSYRAFMSTGRWPDGTMFVLELRRALASQSINNGGYTQGDIAVIEAAAKDSQRFADTGGWKYFEFGAAAAAGESAAPQPPSASCYTCHSQHTAVENTFVQFYPTLFAVAREKGTVKPTYDPNRKVQ